jgi:Na+-driven multidrug efflux pump
VHLEGSVRPLVRLVVPVLLEQALALGVGFTDKWLCGRLLEGPEYLAAVGLVAYCISFMPALFAIAGVPATALVARAVGAGDARTARRATAQALLVGAVVAAVILAAAALGGGRFVRMLGLPSQSSALAIRYLAIVVPALPLMMFTQVGVAALRGAGSMRSGLGVMTGRQSRQGLGQRSVGHRLRRTAKAGMERPRLGHAPGERDRVRLSQ